MQEERLKKEGRSRLLCVLSHFTSPFPPLLLSRNAVLELVELPHGLETSARKCKAQYKYTVLC